jgi:hypothetical protein
VALRCSSIALLVLLPGLSCGRIGYDPLGAASVDSASVEVEVSEGLVARYAFDGTDGTTIVDSAPGHADDGELSLGSPGAGTRIAGKFGRAYQFAEGNTQAGEDNTHFRVSPSSDLDSLTTGMTIATWYRFPSSSASNHQDMLANRASPTEGGTHFSFYVHWNRLVGLKVGDFDTVMSAPFSVPDDQWVHLAGSYDSATETGKVYIDGVEACDPVGCNSSFTPTPALSAPTARDLHLGGGGQNWNTNAAMDETRLYNRALRPDEIALLAGVSGGT